MEQGGGAGLLADVFRGVDTLGGSLHAARQLGLERTRRDTLMPCCACLTLPGGPGYCGVQLIWPAGADGRSHEGKLAGQETHCLSRACWSGHALHAPEQWLCQCTCSTPSSCAACASVGVQGWGALVGGLEGRLGCIGYRGTATAGRAVLLLHAASHCSPPLPALTSVHPGSA